MKVLLLILILAGSLFGAEPDEPERHGKITGFVRDVEGTPVAGATILVESATRTAIAQTKSANNGGYALSGIHAGRYSLKVRAKGFQEYNQAVIVQRDNVSTVNVQLGVEPLTEQVTVTATHGGVEEIETVPQEINVISDEEIEQRAKSVLAQVAKEEVGVTLQRTSPTVGGIFVRGLTGNKVNVFVDGIRYSTSAARGGINTFLNLIDPTDLSGVEILRGPNSAQYGSDAIGGSVQLLSRDLRFTDEGSQSRSGISTFGNTADNGYGATVWTSYSGPSIAFLGSVNARRINEIRPGKGIDSHNSVTRFFGLSSDLFFDDRLRDTDFAQYGGMLKMQWAVDESSVLSAGYIRGQQDGGKRYDQLIGGDGNLIADLRNLMLDLLYFKYDRTSFGVFDHVTLSYSFNTQREERVNQGGNGNPLTPILHEYERTNVHGMQAQMSKLLTSNQTVTIGAELYIEGINSPSFRTDPVTGASSIRRGRVPDDATYRHGGVYAEHIWNVLPDRLRVFTNLRFSAASYEASAEDSPIVNGAPLWPDDSLSVESLTYRFGASWTPTPGFDLLANASRGFRAPHMTDLGTLGLTGSGFEVAAPDVAGLNPTVGSTADSRAINTGLPVEQLGPEVSRTYEVGARYHKQNIDTDFSFFMNDVDDNIAKQALILPQGAVGLFLGDQPITAQTEAGAVFVAASPSPVLVRVNFDDARLYGFEHTFRWRFLPAFLFSSIFTYTHAEDRRTGLPPNIEGGIPAPQGYLKLRFAPQKRNFWVEPYLHYALDQDRLSTLDLEDRRTGATRSRSSITNFFYNGATARGLVGPGNDAAFGTADDILLATGETLDQILLRVLGPEGLSAPLYTEVDGFTTINLRFGFTLGEHHQFLLELENLTDENYRGISWGVDAPGRSFYLQYKVDF